MIDMDDQIPIHNAGYAIGAIFSGVIADMFDIKIAIISTGVLVLFSALWIIFRMEKPDAPVLKKSVKI
ncbi:MAG: hypothetical protein EA360_09370 [Balneolaceae bacterium]|nr:MAG: hypothetical protein EA360_09370 [Balneolaceae bacterium]